MTLVRAACPHDCPDTCAMHVTVEDGRATHVDGDPDHPITVGFLCGKVSNYLDRVYSSDRLLHPLIRAGEKGSAEFRRASWDEALDLVVERIQGLGESLLPYSYAGTQGLIQGNSMSARVMNALGASALERTICATAGYTGTLMTHGVSPEVDPEEWPHARYLLVWGWNPMSTAPHLWRKLLDARRAGAKLVVVDPFRSRTARVADEHLRPLPGTDAALGLGMMRAVVDAGLQDEAWCRAHAEGYDELLATLGEWPVERAAEASGVEPEVIARVGREFAETQPALLRLGVGAQRHMGAPTAYRTLAALPALVGAWRHRGGGCSYIPAATARAVSSVPLPRADLRPNDVRTINMSQLGDALTDLEPPVKALVVWNSNPAAIAPEQGKVLAGLKRDDLFTVVLEQFMTDTAAHADVVLPATTQLEHLDLLFSWGHHYLTLNRPAIEPLGEALPNTEIFRRLARAAGLDARWFAESDEELVRAALASDHPLLAGITYERLLEDGYAKVALRDDFRPYGDGGFATPSGKCELYSLQLAKRGLDPLPAFVPASESPAGDPDLAVRYPLALLTAKSALHFLNSSYANLPRHLKAERQPLLDIHPDDAEARDIADGVLVRVFNDRGSLKLRARVGDRVRAGVVAIPS